MAEMRVSFRPHEMRLITGALDAVLRRCKWQMGGLGRASDDSRDWCINAFANDEIEALQNKLRAALDRHATAPDAAGE